MQRYRVALLPGDGIGPEIMHAAMRVLEAAAKQFDFELDVREGLIGSSAQESTRTALPMETIRLCREADAVLMGPVGAAPGTNPLATANPRYAAHELHAWMGIYSNLRPIRFFPGLIRNSPVKPELISGADVMIVRDAAGGLYYGQPRGLTEEENKLEAINTLTYTRSEVERVAHVAFQAARGRSKRLVLADWSKMLETGELWRRVTREVARVYPEVAYETMDTDTCILELTWHPRQFDIILADSMTGDMLSVQAASLSGTFAIHPSAYLGGRYGGIFTPSHGTAPNLTGTGFANPTSAILSGAMMFKYAFGQKVAGERIRAAIEAALTKGARSHDLSVTGEVVRGCEAYVDRVLAELEALAD